LIFRGGKLRFTLTEASVVVEVQGQLDAPLSISVNGQAYSLTKNMVIETGKPL
jgi:hypothetical protein